MSNIPQVISSNLNILVSSQRCPEAFSSLLLVYRTALAKTYVTYWSGPNTTSKHPRLRELSVVREIGARRVLSLERKPHLTFFSTNEQRRIRHHITCSSSNIVYMIQCNKCNVQYIGQTKRHLSDRFGEHSRAIEKAIAKQHVDQPTAVSDHFTLPVKSMDNIELIPLEVITSNRDAIRKARKAFLISKGETLGPLGLNRRDKIWTFYFLFFSVYPFWYTLNFLFIFINN